MDIATVTETFFYQHDYLNVYVKIKRKTIPRNLLFLLLIKATKKQRCVSVVLSVNFSFVVILVFSVA